MYNRDEHNNITFLILFQFDYTPPMYNKFEDIVI